MAHDIIYGIHAVISRLEQQPESIQQLLLLSGKLNPRQQQVLELAEQQGITVNRVVKAELLSFANSSTHQGVVAVVTASECYSIRSIEDIIAQLSPKTLLLILDGVQDPHNLGACLRVADGAGVTAVIAPKDNAVGITPAVRKVASGATETIPYLQVTNLVRALEQLKQAGVWSYGLDGQATQNIYQGIKFEGPIALIMGGEGKGLRRLTKEHCDFLISIPMLGKVESLNVSVAAGITLYEAVRQRR